MATDDETLPATKVYWKHRPSGKYLKINDRHTHTQLKEIVSHVDTIEEASCLYYLAFTVGIRRSDYERIEVNND